MIWGTEPTRIIRDYISDHPNERAEYSAFMLVSYFANKYCYDELLREVVYWKKRA